MQQTRALLAVPLVLLSREESRGVPLKRTFWALQTWIRNCSVGVGPLHRHTSRTQASVAGCVCNRSVCTGLCRRLTNMVLM